MSAIASQRTLDLRGVLCPMNFVRTKLALEDLGAGDVLEVWLDAGEPAENVPRSAGLESHEVLRIEDLGDHVRVWIAKAGS
jgi:tRNA 2-thiouridine synthesizing protein A